MNKIMTGLFDTGSKAPLKIFLGAFLFSVAALFMAKTFSFILNVPGVPYNIKELFLDNGSLFRMFVFSCTILWIGLSAALITEKTVKSRFPYLILPLLTGLSGICSYLLLAAGVTEESIADITGSTNIWGFVINKHIWGDWGVWLFHAIGSRDIISIVERYVRYLALYCPLVFFMVICSAGLEKSTPKDIFKTIGYFALITMPWLIISKMIAFDYSSTDNLNELIASDVAWGMGGGFHLYLLLILIVFNSVYIAKNATGPIYKYFLMAMITFAAVPIGWYLLKTGLVTNFKKYATAYSGIDFLLGPDRKIKLPESVLFLRWSFVYISAVSVLAYGQMVFSLGKTLFTENKIRPADLSENDTSKSFLIKVWCCIAFLIAYGSLFPFHFQFNADQIIQAFNDALHANVRSGLSDITSNFILFLPFGFFGTKAMRTMRYGFGIVFISGIFFALILQVAQFFIPVRVPSFTDVLWNSAGCIAGIISACWIKLPDFTAQKTKGRPAYFSMPIVIAVCWLVSQLIPFVPSIDLGAIKDSLKPLLIYREFSWSACLVHLGSWIMFGSLFFGVLQTRHAKTHFCLIAATVLCLQIVIMTRSISVSSFLGAILAMGAWSLFFNIQNLNAWVLLFLLVIIIFIDGLFPLHITGTFNSFQFIPFHGFLTGNMLNNSIAIFKKIFIYGSLVIMLRSISKKHGITVFIGCSLVFFIELMQIFTLNHSPEITDPLMVLIIALFINAIESDKPDTTILSNPDSNT